MSKFNPLNIQPGQKALLIEKKIETPVFVIYVTALETMAMVKPLLPKLNVIKEQSFLVRMENLLN